MTSKNWIYVLESEGYGRLILESSPLGWEEKKVSIKRSPTYYGLFREFTVKLSFPKDGKTYIQKVYEEQGTEYEINLGIYEYNPSPIDKYYLFFAGLIDLSTYTFSEHYIECDINESSLARKFMSRDDVKVRLDATESIEGVELDQINSSTVVLHQREVLLTAKYELNDESGVNIVSSTTSPLTSTIKGFSLPMKKVSGDLENLRDPSNPGIDTLGSIFWSEIGGDGLTTIKVSGAIKGTMGISPTDTQDKTFKINFRVYTDNTLATFTDEPALWTFTGQLETQPEVDITFDETISSVTSDNVIALIFQQEASLFGSFTCEFDEVTLNIEFNQYFDNSEAQGYLLHEAAEKIVEIITDKKEGFYSDLLGRVELGYVEEGAASKQTIHSGKQIRAIPDISLSTSLSDFFKSINAQRNIGLGIEYDEFNKPFIRLEEKAHWFSGEVITTIHGVTEIKKNVAREWIYNDIVVGYPKSEEYEETTGAEEYNNKFNWSTYIRTIKNKVDLTSPYRGDGYGIEFARRIQFSENPTTDSKYDQDIFTIVVKESGSKYVAAKDEDYDLVENIFSPESVYNLDISPGRMLRANGSIVRAGLEKYLDKDIKFQYAEQKQNLRTQKPGETVIEENDDIDVSTLSQGRWIAELYTFKSILTREKLALITRKPNGIVKFSTSSLENTTGYYYGFILEVNGEVDGQEAEWVLLRVNLKNPDVVLVDPEGNAPELPPVDPPTDPIQGVFEGPFEFVLSS